MQAHSVAGDNDQNRARLEGLNARSPCEGSLSFRSNNRSLGLRVSTKSYRGVRFNPGLQEILAVLVKGLATIPVNNPGRIDLNICQGPEYDDRKVVSKSSSNLLKRRIFVHEAMWTVSAQIRLSLRDSLRESNFA